MQAHVGRLSITLPTAVHLPDIDVYREFECFPIKERFADIPFESIEKLILSNHEYSADDLLSKIVPIYSDDGDILLRETQEKLFSQGLRDILSKWETTDPEKLPQFVQFCSGRSFLPIDPRSNFKIKVAFEIQAVDGSSSSADRLPESHTCESRLSLPSKAYDGDVEVLEEKLSQALEYHGSKTFTMR